MAGLLRRSGLNSRYLTDDSGKAIFLSGGTYFPNLCDAGTSDPPPTFDFTTYCQWLRNYGQNWHRFWLTEQTWLSADSNSTSWRIAPPVWARTGGTNALDGKPKSDLTAFNQAFFDRLRARCIEAWEHGLYSSVMLSGGGWCTSVPTGGFQNPWPGHPFHASNNINGLNGDPGSTGNGLGTYDTTSDAHPYWLALMEKLVDTVADLDYVLFEVCNEIPDTSTANSWQHAMINALKQYEAATYGRVHLTWMSAPHPNTSGTNDNVFTSPADLASPYSVGADWNNNPPASVPPSVNKVVVLDTDHTCGICLALTLPWKALCRGYHLLYTGLYDGSYAMDYDPGFAYDHPDLDRIYRRQGYTVAYSRRMNLNKAVPRDSLANTAYCLASPTEVLVYNPAGESSLTVDLRDHRGQFVVEWFRNDTGVAQVDGVVSAGAVLNLTPPNANYDVLFLFREANMGDIRCSDDLVGMQRWGPL